MLFKKRNGRTPSSSSRNREELFPIVVDGETLLETKHRKNLVLKIKRILSVTDNIWINHYWYALVNFAEIVQELPASESYHHSYNGGLLDHTLETVYEGLRNAQGHILPPKAKPEELIEGKDRWLFGIFISLLAHDIGKVVTEFDIVSREHNGEFQYWYPWYRNLKIGNQYTFRFKVKKSDYINRSHEKVSMTLMPRLLTEKATAWLLSDMDLQAQVFSTLVYSQFGGGIIQEIVRKADGRSVSENVGCEANLNVNHSAQLMVHEKILMAVNQLINDGQFSYNKPGAAFWFLEDHIWLVSKATMEAAQSFLQAQGHKGVPKSVVRIFEILKENKISLPTDAGEVIWKAEVNDFQKNWQQVLTFLKIPIDRLSINRALTEFDGSILIEDPKEGVEMKVVLPPIPAPEIVKPVIADSRTEKKQSNTEGNQDREGHDFFDWLIRSVHQRKLRVNEPKAPIHIIDEGLLLVTPSIFNIYLEGNRIKKRLYESRSNDGRPYIQLQKEIESLKLHRISQNGQNIFKVQVTGQRSVKELSVYFFERIKFSEFKAFSSNPAIKLLM